MVLVVVAIAQLTVVLDATIVNIALPSAQHSLGFPNSDRQWVVTAYALAFGSLLLPGGRIGDMFSRKRVFITGLAGFAIASALGGAAGSFGMLVTARTLQGAFGAILAPNAPWAPWSAPSRTRVSGARPAVPSARWPPTAAPWACSSAGCSLSTSHGAGPSTSTCCSPRSP
jgi:MFS family permease